ncbi:hypothetical protein AAG570_008055 [Ranatra chinensis]|uniref:Uncharacterized protein n=1 Tax=Ranatra chinensis TaxID=642074 RepID=A0ABD0XTM5_9HEMI
MCKEVILFLQPTKGNIIIDMTFGAGGHSEAILETARDLRLFCIDRDPFAFGLAQNLANSHPNRVIACHGKFTDLPYILNKHDIQPNTVDKILFDFGCSSMQFDQPERGFSITNDGPLDMRMDGNQCSDVPTAAYVLENADESVLTKIFKLYGEEKCAKLISRAIIERRSKYQPIKTTTELAELVASIISQPEKHSKVTKSLHVATKVFQALRIYINNELNEINAGLMLAKKYLKVGGRAVAISFHSLEDAIVKRHFNGNDHVNFPYSFDTLKCQRYKPRFEFDIFKEKDNCSWEPLTKCVVTPSSKEIKNNTRSRSAKLRAARKKK